MSSIDGKVLTFEELIQIPNRLAFLDAAKVQECRQHLTSRQPMEFLPVYVWESYLPEKAGVLTMEKFAFRMYKVIISGILKSGEKVVVVLDNVLPFLELRVPRPAISVERGTAAWDAHTQRFKSQVQAVCRDQGFKLKETHVVAGGTVKEYDDRADFIQLCFSSIGERKKALDHFDSTKYQGASGPCNYETTHDDATCYYRMVSRDTLTPWTSWCTLRDYKVTKKHAFFNTLYTINVDYRKIESYKGDIFADPDLREDKTLELEWDIETRDPVETEEIPMPTSRTFTMPNISMSFAWVDAELCPVNACAPLDKKYDWRRPKGHLVQYNITTMMTAPMPNRVTILCRDTSEQIMAFGVIWKKMQPDYDIQFNGHRYDWWGVAEQARQLRLLEFLERNMSVTDLALYRQIEEKEFVNPKQPFTDPSLPAPEKRAWGGYTWWKKYGFKISAELQNVPGACLNYPGYISIDMMMQLRAANNNPERYSMHKFLEQYKLGDKVEMPYKEMFARFDGNRRLFDQLKRGQGPTDKDGRIRLEVTPLEDLHPDAALSKADEHDAWRGKTNVKGAVLYKQYTVNGRDVKLEGDQLTAYNMTYTLRDRAEPGLPEVRVVGSQALISYATVREAVEVAMGEMLEVAEYCIVDGLRCHDLLIKTQFIRDKRQVGILSFTTMDDCVYRANGMKVRQMIIAKAQARGYHVSNRAPKKVETGKYPGAYVFPPHKGIAGPKPSPHEMRYGALQKDGTRKKPDPKYLAWQVMPQREFDRVLDKISECGVWLEDYLPAPERDASGQVVMPTEFPDRRVWDEIAKARYKGLKQPGETLDAFSARYEQIVLAEWVVIYRERYDEMLERTGQTDVDITYDAWFDAFRGDLLGEWPAAFLEWLLWDTHYPIAGLDFSSLYPSLIMTYNFSPEMMVHTLERALELAAQGKKIHAVNFPFNGRTIKGWSVRSRYPEKQVEIDALLKLLQKLAEQLGDTLEAEMEASKKLEALLVDTEFGLFPTVLKDLFDQRVALKASLKPLTHRLEEFKLMTAEQFAACAAEYTVVMGKWNYLNSKQKALKVFMNTFYGESGNALSPLRVLALAGGVTSGGQYNIKKVAQLVQDILCRIYYGDTDSVYISMPRRTFRRFDKAYYSQRGTWVQALVSRKKNKKDEIEEVWEWVPINKIKKNDGSSEREHRNVGPLGKLAYYDCLVTESFRLIKIVNKHVNDALEADNGTKFLNMAFEEFLYPAMFFSKKKYGGVAHEGTFNFAFFTKEHRGVAADADQLFVRGLEFVKKGTSEMLKDISVNILLETLGIENIDSIDVIVERMIEKIYTERNIEYEKFIMTASYKPNKQNVKVHTFHARMEALGMAPEPLDRFRYVMVKKYPFKYDLKGKKSALSVGDRMEYADRARLLNMEIDLDYYMGASVCGQLARFISWRDDFAVEPRDDSDEAYNEAEKKNIGAAQKYIERCYERWSDKHTSKGPALRTLYKKVNGVFHEEFSAVMKVSDIWQFENSAKTAVPNGHAEEKNHVQAAYEENQGLFQNIVQKIDKQVLKESRKEAEQIIAAMTLTDVTYAGAKRNCYRQLLASRKQLAQKQLPVLHQQLRGKVQQLRKLFTKRDNILEQCIAGLSGTVGIDKEDFDTLEPIIANIERIDTSDLRRKINHEIGMNVTHQDLMVLSEIDGIYLKMLSVHKLVRITEVVYDELGNYIHYKVGGMPVAVDHLDDLDEWMADNLDD